MEIKLKQLRAIKSIDDQIEESIKKGLKYFPVFVPTSKKKIEKIMINAYE